jgi:aspartate kinase
MASEKLIVVKYGGSVLEDGLAFRDAAEAVKAEYERGRGVVVVVSALRGVTDQLLGVAEDISPDTPKEVIDHIIGLGEEQSARLMASALKGMGVDAVEITPDSPSWPIITDETYGDAEPIVEECLSNVELGLKPLVERGRIPVVCGFTGRSLAGNITTLGRGGSDTTAVILGRCLGADEVVLVKDVAGVYSADPKKVESASPIGRLNAWEANLMASAGAEVLHGKVFKYKPGDLPIRIVSRHGPLDGDGTMIDGTLPENLVEPYERPVFLLNLVGDIVSNPSSLTHVTEAVEAAGGRSLGLKGNGESTLLVVDGDPLETLNEAHKLVESGEVKAVSCTEDLAYLTIKGRGLDATEEVSKAMKALTGLGVKVPWVQVGHSWFSLLVDHDRVEEAVEIVEATLKG